MIDADYVRVAAREVITSFRALAASIVPQRQAQNVPSASTTVSAVPLVVSSTHQFEAPPRRLVPTFTNISSTPAPLYIETTMFALHELQHITNWDNRSAYVFINTASYLSLVQLHNTDSRPLQLHDQLLFLQASQHPFVPHDPWGTICTYTGTYLLRVNATSVIHPTSNPTSSTSVPGSGHLIVFCQIKIYI